MQMLYKLNVATNSRTELLDITSQIEKKVDKSGVKSGICHIFVPHTTAGITINENADPSVVHDILMELNKAIPFQDGYHHSEGNSAAHIKSSLMGQSIYVIIDGGRLKLGTWQGIYFCEFDGSRNRQVWVKIMPDAAG
jgi:secondary thiamine-phosphate synthase enzyme